MPKPTGYSLNDYIRAVEVCAPGCGYGKFEHGYKGGSIYGFRLFENETDDVPAVIWVVHFSHDRKQDIYSSDLKKAWERTAIAKEDFLREIAGKKK